MESASKIFDYLYLGTEWNASNKEELEANKSAGAINRRSPRSCKYIVNVTKEISNAFPGKIKYHNVRCVHHSDCFKLTCRIYDTPTAELLPHWEDTYRFIREARYEYVLAIRLTCSRAGSSVLVHCKMGVSRSASTVIAYAMKQYSWSLEVAYAYVKVWPHKHGRHAQKRRSIVKPNEGFRQQLIVYEGILRAQ